jgi:hypothetical protein
MSKDLKISDEELACISFVESAILELNEAIYNFANINNNEPVTSDVIILKLFQDIFTSSKNNNINIKFTIHILKFCEIVKYIYIFNNSFSKKKRNNDSGKIKDLKVKYNYHFNFICQRLYCNINDIENITDEIKYMYESIWNMAIFDKNGCRKRHSRSINNNTKNLLENKNLNGKIHINYDGLSVQNMPIFIQFKNKTLIAPYFGFDNAVECLTCLLAYIDTNSSLCSILNTDSDKKAGCIYRKTKHLDSTEYCFYLEIRLPFENDGIVIKSYDTRIIHALCKVPYSTNELSKSLEINNHWEDSLIHFYKLFQKNVENTIRIQVNKKFNDPTFMFAEIYCDNSKCNYSQIIEKWDGISDKKYNCIKCYNSVMCHSCCDSYHEGECNPISDKESNTWIKKNTQPCPLCKTNIEKDGGCNHMTCIKCNPKIHFCWICKTVYSLNEINDHYNDADPFAICIQRLNS